jgi:hypothetical protein
MTEAPVRQDAMVLDPPAATVRKLFRLSAQALLANRPLSEVAGVGAGPAAQFSKTELGALVRVGLSTQPWAGAVADDPLAKTIVDHMALVETSLGTAQAAKMLGVDVSRVRQRLRERSLLGVEYEGEWRLPRVQFERNKVLPGLPAVLAGLPADVTPLDVTTWLLEPNVDLEGRTDGVPLSPRQWLLRGGAPEQVAKLARDL